jgi:hypothetical protein
MHSGATLRSDILPGLGASVWWPCKDHAYDEPDSQTDRRSPCRNRLMDVSNGRLRRVTDNKDGTRTFEWFVANPINNYGVNVNIGNYARICRHAARRKRHCSRSIITYCRKTSKKPKFSSSR